MEISKLRQERERRKLSASEVARQIGIPPSNLSRIERGEQAPRQDVARALYRFFNGRVTLGDCYDPMYRIEFGGLKVVK